MQGLETCAHTHACTQNYTEEILKLFTNFSILCKTSSLKITERGVYKTWQLCSGSWHINFRLMHQAAKHNTGTAKGVDWNAKQNWWQALCSGLCVNRVTLWMLSFMFQMYCDCFQCVLHDQHLFLYSWCNKFPKQPLSVPVLLMTLNVVSIALEEARLYLNLLQRPFMLWTFSKYKQYKYQL